MESRDSQAAARNGARRLAAVLVLTGTMLPGCLIIPYRYVETVEISDDGQFAACTTTQGIIAILFPMGIRPEAGHIRWTHADSWFARSRRLFFGVGGVMCGYGSAPGRIWIAPDSKHFVFMDDFAGGIMIAEAKTGRSRVLGGGEPYSLAWLSDSEIAYAWKEDVKRPPSISRLLFLLPPTRMIIHRYDIKSGSGDPQEVCRSHNMWLPHWSPGGKHVVLYPDPSTQRRIPVVDVETGETLAELGRRGEYIQAVAWTPDERDLLLASTNRSTPKKPSHEMARVRLSHFNTATRQTTVVDWDSLEGQAELYLADDPDRFSINAPKHMEWTADGRFVVGNFPGYQGCLLDFKARKLISLREKLDKRFSRVGWWGVKWTELHAFPVAGWLWTKADNGNSYAVDYEARHVVLISKDDKWDVSRDGRRIAEANLFLNPVIRHFTLPDLKPVAGE